jgi:hypothetical protein
MTAKKSKPKKAQKSVKKKAAARSTPKKAAAKKRAPKPAKKTAASGKRIAVVSKKIVEAPGRSIDDLPIKHVAVAGNIGSGKTTLTEKLAQNFKWEAQYEDVEGNPYLNDFYEDMPRWSFALYGADVNTGL